VPGGKAPLTYGTIPGFDYGMVIDEYALGGEPGAFKLLTGISADERAIFFFDQGTGRSAALFRSRPEAPFYDSVDFGERRGLGPNADCTRVYSSDADGLVRQNRE
jgi:hypothetical protein